MYNEECEFQQESHGCNSPHVHVLIYINTTCFDIKISSAGVYQAYLVVLPPNDATSNGSNLTYHCFDF
jgi:hypothetical protein